MLIEMDKIRDQHRRAVWAFYDDEWNNRDPLFEGDIDLREQFYKEYGEKYNMKVIIDEWKNHFGRDHAVITTVEFNSEQDLTYFLLRWS